MYCKTNRTFLTSPLTYEKQSQVCKTEMKMYVPRNKVYSYDDTL